MTSLPGRRISPRDFVLATVRAQLDRTDAHAHDFPTREDYARDVIEAMQRIIENR